MKLYSDFGNLDRIPDGEERKLPTKASDIGALPTSGGTLTGSLYLKGNPTQDKEAATKEYVDSVASSTGFEHPIILEENTDYGATDPTSPRTGQLFFNTGNTLADLVYPIGSVYISVNNTSPETLFGGTWTKISEKFLLSSGTNYPSGSAGGEATHKLTQSELPYLEEPVRVSGETALNFTSQGGTATGSADMLMHTAQWKTTAANPAVTATNRMYVQLTGGDKAHNNMPPYMVVNMWYRTA